MKSVNYVSEIFKRPFTLGYLSVFELCVSSESWCRVTSVEPALVAHAGRVSVGPAARRESLSSYPRISQSLERPHLPKIKHHRMLRVALGGLMRSDSRHVLCEKIKMMARRPK